MILGYNNNRCWKICNTHSYTFTVTILAITTLKITTFTGDVLMHRRLQLLFAILICLTLTASNSFTVSAKEDVNDKQETLEENQEILEDTEQELKELKKDIDDQQAKQEKLEKSIEETTRKVADTQEELNRLKDSIQGHHDSMNARLRTMYMSDDLNYIDVILNSGSISEILVNLDMIKEIHKNDKHILHNMEISFEKISEKELELSEEKESLESKQKKASQNMKELGEKKAKLEAEAKRIKAENEKLEQEIQNMIAAAQTEGASDEAGYVDWDGAKMKWPVKGGGHVSSEYGYRMCPFHGREIHRGLDISCPYGTDIVAAEKGTVITAGWGGSYGNMVIISHGGGISTLYGHNSSLVVSVGQHVKKGQTIAKAGSTGSSTGNHCHFEVRVNGQHTDPDPFLGR